MGKIAVVRALERHDYGPLEALLHRLRFFTGGRFFARIDRWKKGPSAQKRRIRPILAHEPGVFGAWEPHTSWKIIM